MGTAGIAEKVCVAIAEASNATVAAVASRDKAKAEEYIKANCPGARAYGSYEELLDDADIQVVYLPLPTSVRPEWVVKAAAKKKHILCEKPIAGNAEDSKKVFDAVRQAGVQFMDNTMMMHNSRLDAIRKVLDDEAFFGRPQHVVSTFTLPFGATVEDFKTGNIRMKAATEPLGCLGDLGWYCARFTQWVFGYDAPESVSCTYLETTDEGVPLRLVANLKFSTGRSASFDCSFTHALRYWAEIASEKCSLRVEDFVITSKPDVCSFTVTSGGIGEKALTFPITELKSEEIRENPQHTRLIEKFSTLATSGEIDESWMKISEQTNQLLLALEASAKQQGAWLTV
jgi:predicted dehydrogenase